MTIAEGLCSIRYHFAQKKKTCIVHHSSNIYKYIYIYISHTPVLYSVQSRQNGTLVRHVGSGQETWHGLVATLGGSSIASQSRINRRFFDQMKTKSAKQTKKTLQMLCLIWEFDVLTFYVLLPIGSARMHHDLNDIIIFHHDILWSFSTMTNLFLEVV